MSSNSSGSTYSPVTVIVPALKPNHTLIAGLAQNVSEGYKIEPVYHAEDLGNDSADDENTLMDIRNASSYESHSTAQTSLTIGRTTSYENPLPEDLTVNSTIKFNEFAQLLVYDGSRRSKYQENSTLDLDQHQKSQYNSQNHITDIIRAGSVSKAFGIKKHRVMKNNGTLALGSAAFGKSKRLRNLQLSQFSKFVTSPIDKESVEATRDAFENESIRSILKSKHNRNAETESIRARYCDDIEVGEFMVFFENYERQRIETEPILNRIRERQLLQYYDTEDEMADGYSSDESTEQYDP